MAGGLTGEPEMVPADMAEIFMISKNKPTDRRRRNLPALNSIKGPPPSPTLHDHTPSVLVCWFRKVIGNLWIMGTLRVLQTRPDAGIRSEINKQPSEEAEKNETPVTPRP